MDYSQFFNHIEKYVSLNIDERDILLKHLTYRRFLKGQYIVQAGDICYYDSFVIKGCVRTFFIDNEGNDHTVKFAIENWWAGDLGSFIAQAPAYFNVQCLEVTEVLQFSHENLQKLFMEIPKMERFFRLILQEAYVASEKRIVRNISSSAKDRYLQFKKRHPDLEQRVPQYMIASYLGITKEFLSKMKRQLNTEQE